MQQDQDSELKVFISSRDSVCDECREQLGHQAQKQSWLTVACCNINGSSSAGIVIVMLISSDLYL